MDIAHEGSSGSVFYVLWVCVCACVPLSVSVHARALLECECEFKYKATCAPPKRDVISSSLHTVAVALTAVPPSTSSQCDTNWTKKQNTCSVDFPLSIIMIWDYSHLTRLCKWTPPLKTTERHYARGPSRLSPWSSSVVSSTLNLLHSATTISDAVVLLASQCEPASSGSADPSNLGWWLRRTLEMAGRTHITCFVMITEASLCWQSWLTAFMNTDRNSFFFSSCNSFSYIQQSAVINTAGLTLSRQEVEFKVLVMNSRFQREKTWTTANAN